MSYFFSFILNNKKYLLIFLFISIFNSFLIKFYFIFKFKKDDIPLFKYNEVKSFYPGAKNFELNYKKKCGEIFKYKANNEKDLIIFAYEFYNRSKYHNLFMEHAIEKVLNSLKFSIPRAHIICFVPELSINNKIVLILKKYRIEIIKISNSKQHITNRRFIEAYKFLNKNKDKYERVLHIDIDDIYIFGDIFATIGENDFYVNYNCNTESKNLTNCKKFFKSCNKKWFEENMYENNTNKTEVEIFKNKNPITIIAGVFVGGINNFINFLELYTQKLIQYNNNNQMNNFGYDQILFNFLFYLGYFDNFKLKPIGCEQRMCFRPENILFNNKTTKIIYENSGCSPILIHKCYPNSWISLEHKILNNFDSK